MNNESYSLILSTLNTSNVNLSNNGSSNTFYINWDSILPRKYESYQLTWQLKATSLTNISFSASITTAGVLTLISSSLPLFVGMGFDANGIICRITSITTPGTTYQIYPNPSVAIATTTFYSINTCYPYLVAIDFGSKSTTISQSNTVNTTIGYITTNPIPLTNNLFLYNYGCSYNDNGPTKINYPNNSSITVKITQIDGITLLNDNEVFDYVLQLYFTPIITDQEAINNAALLAGKF
jgi:hypothetical protein